MNFLKSVALSFQMKSKIKKIFLNKKSSCILLKTLEIITKRISYVKNLTNSDKRSSFGTTMLTFFLDETEFQYEIAGFKAVVLLMST